MIAGMSNCSNLVTQPIIQSILRYSGLGLTTDDNELDNGLGKEFHDPFERNLGGIFGHIPLTITSVAERHPLVSQSFG
jgi:hypothetical protein